MTGPDQIFAVFVAIMTDVCHGSSLSVQEPGLVIPHVSGVPRGEGGFGVFKPPPPKFRSFDKAAFYCRLSGKRLLFLFQHPN